MEPGSVVPMSVLSGAQPQYSWPAGDWAVVALQQLNRQSLEVLQVSALALQVPSVPASFRPRVNWSPASTAAYLLEPSTLMGVSDGVRESMPSSPPALADRKE